jgi:hypothetical protein
LTATVKAVGVGVLERAAEQLRSDKVQFAPVLDDINSSGSTWTLADALVHGCGCRRSAGPLAYWEHLDISQAIKEAFDRIAAAAGVTNGKAWSNEPQRKLSEVLDVLETAAAGGDVAAPELVRLRPWCDPSKQFTCRIPFVPLAALMHAWKLNPCPLDKLVGDYDLEMFMDPWVLLERVEPDIVDTSSPGGVAEDAAKLRLGMKHWPIGPIYSPTKLFVTIAATDPSLEPGEFAAHVEKVAPAPDDELDVDDALVTSDA